MQSLTCDNKSSQCSAEVYVGNFYRVFVLYRQSPVINCRVFVYFWGQKVLKMESRADRVTSFRRARADRVTAVSDEQIEPPVSDEHEQIEPPASDAPTLDALAFEDRPVSQGHVDDLRTESLRDILRCAHMALDDECIMYVDEANTEYIPFPTATETCISVSSLSHAAEEENAGSGPCAHFYKKNSRKRQRKSGTWKRARAKYARQHGEAYVNQKGVFVSAKVPVRSDSLCKCRYKCSEIPQDVKESIHAAFYQLDENGKNAYLFGCIEAYQPKCFITTAERHRKWSYSYSVLIDGSRRKVCCRALCRLHDIGKKKVRSLCGKVSSGCNSAPCDMRGKHHNRPKKLAADVIDRVKQHIASFPSETSHYSRTKNPNRKYLSPLLSINKMYNLYKNECDKNNILPVSSASYRKLFTEEFNLGFGSPRTDTCTTCDKSSDGCQEHKQKADYAFDVQKKDRLTAASSDNVQYITFDLQKSLPLPKLSTSTAFYLR